MRILRKQQGVILLTLILVILAAGSFVLLKALNVAADKSGYDESVTRAALKEAKLALMGFAVHKPALGLGPGRLPCPDLSGDGQAVGTCSLGGVNETTGWFPYETVGMSRTTDSSGAGLWYSLAESHRNSLIAAMNSDTGDTTDDLSLDGSDDIVAIIIAPGPAIANQDRADNPGLGDYLEGDNATSGDAAFTGAGTAPFNDSVITITRAELMAAVEKRVLGEVNKRLGDYFSTYGGFPWPSPFSDPVTKVTFSEVVSANEGHLPVHRNGENFAAAFSLDWSVPADGVTSAGVIPQDACLRSNQCNDDDADIFYDFSGITVAGGTCTWTNAEAFDCTAIGAPLTVAGGATLERTYTLSLSGISPGITAPTAGAGRSRNFIYNGRMPDGSSGAITVSDVLDGASRGTRTLTLDQGDMVNIALQNVPFLLGDDSDIVATAANSPAALPRWFTANLWHHYVYYAFSPSDSIGNAATCDPLALSCLTVQIGRVGLPAVPNGNIRGLAMIAGRALTGLPRGAAMSNYFESENDQESTPNTTFSSVPISTVFSDQVSILGSVP